MNEQKRKQKLRKKKKRKSLRMDKSKFATILIIVCIAGIVTYDYIQRSNRSFLKEFDPARTKGNKEAPIKITEYIDFQCQECARGYIALKKYLGQHPDKIFLQMKYSPHDYPNSLISAIYAECAARQNKFWKMHDLLLQRQPQWRTLSEARPYLQVLASNAGVDLNKLDECYEANDARATVLAEKAYAESLFIRSTPTYFINDEMVVGVESLQEKLDAYFSSDDSNY